MTATWLTVAPEQRLTSPAPAAGGDYGRRLLQATVQTYLNEIDDLARRAKETLDLLARPSADVADAVGAAARRAIPRWHFEMLNDTQRNDALLKSIAAAVRPGDHVLDIGSGTGLLAMAAAQSGAARVTTCEANPVLAEIARQVIDEHGYSDVITVLPRWSTDLDADRDLGGKVDLVVSEIVDCGLIGEGLLPTVRHARKHLLAPGGRMVPGAAKLLGRLVSSAAAAGLNRVDTVGGFDLTGLNLVSTNGHFPLRTATRRHRLVSPAVELAAFDLFTDPLTDETRRLTLPVTESGLVHGLVAWFELDLGDGAVLDNAPENVTSHWGQAFVAFDRPIAVRTGDVVAVDLTWADGRLFASAY
jgi:type II protein arginine methyltransferase